jgi:hypothetical protein
MFMKTRYVSEKFEKFPRLGAVNQVSENKAVNKAPRRVGAEKGQSIAKLECL